MGIHNKIKYLNFLRREYKNLLKEFKKGNRNDVAYDLMATKAAIKSLKKNIIASMD